MIKNVRIKFDKIHHDTGKAILVSINGKEHWIPKKLCRKLIINNKLGGNVIIPTFLYEKIFDTLPTLEQAETIIEKHIPTKIEPKQQAPDENLIR